MEWSGVVFVDWIGQLFRFLFVFFFSVRYFHLFFVSFFLTSTLSLEKRNFFFWKLMNLGFNGFFDLCGLWLMPKFTVHGSYLTVHSLWARATNKKKQAFTFI